MQEAPDEPEDVAKLPQLTVADIGPAPAEPAYGLAEGTPVPCIRHHLHTRGLVFAYRCFDMSCLEFEDLPYAAVLGIVLGKLGTDAHSAAEIDTLTNGKLGNCSFFCEVYEDEYDPEVVTPTFVASASALAENVEWLAQLPSEILEKTDFSDTGKIRDALQQRRIGMEQSFANAGHAAAMARLTSYFLPAGVVRQQLGGVDFHRFLVDVLDNFNDRAAELAKRLEQVAHKLLRQLELVGVACRQRRVHQLRFWQNAGITAGTRKAPTVFEIPKPQVRNEAFIVPTDVCYASTGFDRRSLGAP